MILCLAQKTASIDFEAYRFNLGIFAKTDGIKTCTFKFINTGDAKLVIDHLSVGCPCTTAKYSKKTFLPGESGEIVATYDGTHQSVGAFEIEIIVASNAASKYIRLILAGNLVATQEDVLASQQLKKNVAADAPKKQDSWLRRLKQKLSNMFKSSE